MKERKWQPIATVPTDGTPVLVWLPQKMLRSHVHAAYFSHGGKLSVVGGVFSFDATCEPTHWMTQPEAP